MPLEEPKHWRARCCGEERPLLAESLLELLRDAPLAETEKAWEVIYYGEAEAVWKTKLRI